MLTVLIAGLFFQPRIRGLVPDDGFSRFFIEEHQEGKGDGRQPPVEPERPQVQAFVSSGKVDQESSEADFEDHGERQRPVVEAVLEDGEATSFADDHVDPLAGHDGHKVGRVAGLLQNFPRLVGPFLVEGISQVVD